MKTKTLRIVPAMAVMIFATMNVSAAPARDTTPKNAHTETAVGDARIANQSNGATPAPAEKSQWTVRTQSGPAGCNLVNYFEIWYYGITDEATAQAKFDGCMAKYGS